MVAVPLVAVTNTVVVYLRAYSRDQQRAAAAATGPGPHGATALPQAERDQGAHA